MLDVGLLVWKLSSMPKNPMDLVAICKKYAINRLAIKVLDGRWKYNVPNGDKPLMEYMQVLTDNGIIVEGWGFHYPENPGPQGDAIEERRQKLGFKTYHVNAEGHWQKKWGMPAATKLMLAKVKVNNFEMLLCSYRFTTEHPLFPFNAFLLHETMNGSSPQVYWALAHNPGEQLNRTLFEYSKWNKPVYPMGPLFGATFKVNSNSTSVYWEPTVDEIVEFRTTAKRNKINRLYYYSMDWALAHQRFDWLEAATGVNNEEEPPVEPPTQPDMYKITNCSWLNGRSEPNTATDNRVLTVRAGQYVENLKRSSGNWANVGLGHMQFWMDSNYLDPD